jgi:hypothetical protein
MFRTKQTYEAQLDDEKHLQTWQLFEQTMGYAAAATLPYMFVLTAHLPQGFAAVFVS